MLGMAPSVAASPLKLVILGDSLTAGYGLAAEKAFPARLEAALRQRGRDVEVVNAGVSGDTAQQGLERLDWSVEADADAVIVELGANDALRGLDPNETRKSLDQIIGRLTSRNIPVLLAGMLAPPNLGAAYKEQFDAIYPELAKKHDVPLYPFFLDGVAAEQALNLEDGIHPNAQGIEEIVRRMMPHVEEFLVMVKD
ncbi:MAG TPA: arylesterase [Aestuariivirgaceae bacterium]